MATQIDRAPQMTAEQINRLIALTMTGRRLIQPFMPVLFAPNTKDGPGHWMPGLVLHIEDRFAVVSNRVAINPGVRKLHFGWGGTFTKKVNAHIHDIWWMIPDLTEFAARSLLLHAYGEEDWTAWMAAPALSQPPTPREFLDQVVDATVRDTKAGCLDEADGSFIRRYVKGLVLPGYRQKHGVPRR